MNVKLNEAENASLVHGISSGIKYFELEAIPTTGSFGKIKFSVSSSSDVYSLETPQRSLFDSKYNINFDNQQYHFYH